MDSSSNGLQAIGLQYKTHINTYRYPHCRVRLSSHYTGSVRASLVKLDDTDLSEHMRLASQAEASMKHLIPTPIVTQPK